MRRRRRLWIALLAAPLVLLAADTLYWSIAERRLEDGFAAWVAWRRSEGWSVNAASAIRSGWPLQAVLIVPGISLVGGDPMVPGGLAWSADRLSLRVALLRPGMLQAAADGRQRLRLGGSPRIAYTAERMHVVLPMQADLPPRFADFAADNLAISTPLRGDAAGTTDVGTLRAHLDFRPAAKSGEPALGFAVQADTLTPPSSIGRILGPHIANLTIDGALDGPVAPARTLSEGAAAWRDGGGRLEVRHVALNWGPLDLTADTTLALDGQLQPTGSGNARVVGYAETLDALAAHGVTSKSAATAAKAVLSLLAHSPKDGGPPDVEVPLSLQDRTLSMHDVPLVRLPEIDWR